MLINNLFKNEYFAFVQHFNEKKKNFLKGLTHENLITINFFS